MTDYIQAWQCVGCGKIEAPQPCIGVCRDRRILMVARDDHERVLAELGLAQERVQTAIALLVRIAHSTPRPGLWERSYRALQQQSREAMRNWKASRADVLLCACRVRTRRCVSRGC